VAVTRNAVQSEKPRTWDELEKELLSGQSLQASSERAFTCLCMCSHYVRMAMNICGPPEGILLNQIPSFAQLVLELAFHPGVNIA